MTQTVMYKKPWNILTMSYFNSVKRTKVSSMIKLMKRSSNFRSNFSSEKKKNLKNARKELMMMKKVRLTWLLI